MLWTEENFVRGRGEQKGNICSTVAKVSELSEIMLYRGLAGCQRNKELLRKS